MQAIKFCDDCEASASPDKVSLVGWFIGFQGMVNRRGFLLRQIIGFSLYFVGLVLVPSFQLLGLIVLLPGLALHVSALVGRFHDTGKSGWSFFLLLIPLLNIIVWAMMFLSSDDAISNDHGRNPTGVKVGV